MSPVHKVRELLRVRVHQESSGTAQAVLPARIAHAFGNVIGMDEVILLGLVEQARVLLQIKTRGSYGQDLI
jgi:hypothetical protein